jgi:hypothetical protein
VTECFGPRIVTCIVKVNRRAGIRSYPAALRLTNTFSISSARVTLFVRENRVHYRLAAKNQFPDVLENTNHISEGGFLQALISTKFLFGTDGLG